MGGAGETRGGECVCDGEEWGGMASMGGSGETRRRRECVCGPLFAPSPMLGLLMST